MSEKAAVKVNIIFVCTGNTCRSPMAEFMFKDYLRKNKRSADFRVASAGLEAGKGDIMAKQAAEALSILGIKHNPERKAKLFTVQMSIDGELVIGMTDEHAYRCGGNAISFVDLIGRHIPDPYGYGVQAYLTCADMMESAFGKILEFADEILAKKRNA